MKIIVQVVAIISFLVCHVTNGFPGKRLVKDIANAKETLQHERRLTWGGQSSSSSGGGGWYPYTRPTAMPTAPTESPTNYPTLSCYEYIDVTITAGYCDGATWDGRFYKISDDVNGYPFYETEDGRKQFGVFSHIPCGNRDGTYRYNHFDTYNNTGYYYWAFNYNRRGSSSDYEWDRDHSSSSYGGWNGGGSSSDGYGGYGGYGDSSGGHGHHRYRNHGKKLFYNNPVENGTDETMPGDMPDWDCVTNHAENFKSGQRYGDYSITSLVGCYHSCTNAPTTMPTDRPTTSPTDRPTDSPTARPTDSPTDRPTTSPTDRPTTSPTDKPSTSPSDRPTESPSDRPTDSPTTKPTGSPTEKPTQSPSSKPTATPTEKPTTSPSNKPSDSPTNKPSVSPSNKPSASPSERPTASPTEAEPEEEDCEVEVELDISIDDLEAYDFIRVFGDGTGTSLTNTNGDSLYYDSDTDFVFLSFTYAGSRGALNGTIFTGCYAGTGTSDDSCFALGNSTTMMDILSVANNGELTYWIGECSTCGDFVVKFSVVIGYDTNCVIIIDTMPVSISAANNRLIVNWVHLSLFVLFGVMLKFV